jgi:hypothetical protein
MFSKETPMRNIASIGIAIGALAVATLPTLADDQAIGQAISLATGRIDGSARPAQTDNQRARASWQRSAVRAAPFPQVSNDAYAGVGEGGAYMRTCGHIGGPKGGNWTCR